MEAWRKLPADEKATIRRNFERWRDLPADQRLEGTLATCTIGIQRGADILRVHDVEPVVRLARMTDAILRAGNSND